LHEAQHLAKLRHPHVVTIYEIGDAGGEPYLTMDYVDGEPLTERLSRGPLSPTQAVELLKQVASAVQHAHKHGIVHRDLKPANILLNHQGEAFVTDVGLARQMQRDSTLTQTGEVLGTPQYMAPDQARGETSLVGEATDIHALGLILYEMLTGRRAFDARSPADVLVKLLHKEPDPPRRHDHRIPRDLETICLKCLHKEPAARPQPARIRLADEVRLLSPAQAAPLNLNDAIFRWQRVSNAAYYQVQFLYSVESPHPTSTIFAFIRANEPQLRLSKLGTADRKAIAENLLAGRTGVWSVVAYDANDPRVGVSLEERRFLVAEQLSNE
jgi:serine/threonine-protein kinase